MLGKELEHTLNRAFQYAQLRRHEYVTVEHLLLALLSNSSARNVLLACGGVIESLEKQLEKAVEENTPVQKSDDGAVKTVPTSGFQRVLQRAVFHVQSSQRDNGTLEVDGANVLIAIYGEQDSFAVYLLHEADIERYHAVSYIAHSMHPGTEQADAPQEQAKPDQSADSQSKAINKYCAFLNKQAQEGQIDSLIGRSLEIERVVQVLCRRQKNNALLVGEAGVGKTAIAEGLAKKIVDGEAPAVLANAKIYSLDLGALLAGTKYRGDFEKRLKELLADLKEVDEAILFIDEIHTIIGAGSASGSAVDVSNLIKPLLSKGKLRCIGSTTFQEFRETFEKDHALARRFQRIDVYEPSIKETIEILKGVKTHFEDHHHVRITNAALRSAVELSTRHITDKYLPDKAIDVIDEAGAANKLLAPSKQKRTIGTIDIERVVARIAQIPARHVSSNDAEQLKHLSRNLKMLVFGQDEAIENLADSVKMARAGLKAEEKPIGNFLFAGPTGVGKTEVTRQLASCLGIKLIRFDMSEYTEKHSIARLVGAPPGYVGFEQGGLLTEAVNRNPYSVILFDEIEKAHPDLYNILLQVMDYGKMTDTKGRQVDFRHVILIMTSNAGAEDVYKSSVGFTEQDHSSDGMSAIKRQFAPEFRNRLDAIIQFQPLSRKDIINVVDKFFIELQSQLDHRHVLLEVDDETKQWFAENGYSGDMGARPMARLINEQVKKPLANILLFDALEKDTRVRVSIEDGAVKVVAAIDPINNTPKEHQEEL